ncbi:hypothetical protein [Undibacterium sp.]|uniref:hypothetical protein n=1 Tax=Undibacterium sp. TaxID=1914977 RepID=UPI0027318AB4|nr:hypothetical protein [Undibacterium sp.]MDP1978373.1 hypothetical protein [Undibacterium sp.]
MTFRIWTNKVDTNHDFTESQVRDMKALMGINLTGGVQLAEIWPNVVIDILSEYPPADSFLCGPMLIVRKPLADVLFEFASKDDIEFLPVDVLFNGKLQGEYGFINVRLICDALDRKRSTFTELDGVVDSINRIRIDGLAAKNKSIFLLDSIEWVLCICDVLAERIERENFSGLSLKQDIEWRPF